MSCNFSCIITISISLLIIGCAPKHPRVGQQNQNQQINGIGGDTLKIESAPINTSIVVSQDILKDTTLVSTFKAIDKLVISKSLHEYKIAVLVPLSGVYQRVGRQIIDGIFKLYMDNDLNMRISFFDSSVGDANFNYQFIVNSGFNIVIGHLLSEKIGRVKFSTQVVNVSLNKPPKPFRSPYNASINFIVDSQVEQLTEQALKHNLSRAIILVDNTAKGAALAERMSDSWYGVGGDVAQIGFIGSKVNQINQQFSSLFRTKQTVRIYETNSKGKLSLKGGTKDYFPFIRQDIDVIFSFLSLEQSRYLVPALELIGGITPAIYSSSKFTRSESFSPKSDRDLQGINYLDMPWRYNNSGFELFEAVGIDALALGIQLWSTDRFEYQGLTGRYLFSAQEIRKKLDWYRFDNKKISSAN